MSTFVSSMYRNSTECQKIINGSGIAMSIGITPSLELWHIYVTFIVLGVCTTLVAKGFNTIRTYIYKDQQNLDTDFDAGGKVSVGLTATTIVSQWTWAATLLQSSSVAAKFGISGPLWYASGATIQILLFAMISVQLKIRAPGAKTFLRVIQARFGKATHITFAVFALLTNVIVTAMLTLGGAAVMVNLVKGLSLELATGLVVVVTGTYTYIGGLGATFYVSYINTGFIYIIMLTFLLRVYHSPSSALLGDVNTMYDYLHCTLGPKNNKDRSYLTLVSSQGLIFGIINIVGNFGTVFVDQSYWQSSVAAKPKQGVWGFLSGGLTWFAVPFTFATTMGLAYIALGADQGHPLLTDSEIDKGLVAPVVAQKLMGSTGEILILVMILMAVTSTGSAEIMAVTSIFVYDVYQLYLKPYRMVHDANTCILCGKQRGRNAHPRDKCTCISMTLCPHCHDDDESRKQVKRLLKPAYKCKAHGEYRKYNDYLLTLKNWCMAFVSLSVIPLTMMLDAMKISLGWVYLFMGVIIGSAVIPIILCMFWARITGKAMMTGAIGGAVIGLVSWLVVSATQDGGLSDFFVSTGSEISMLTGNLCAILSGGVLAVIATYITNWHYDPATSGEVWETTRDIDNPLSPWTELYARDLGLSGANRLGNRPLLEEVANTFKSARLVANIGALMLSVLLVVVWPAAMTAVGVLGPKGFTSWVAMTAGYGFLATIFIILFPVASEAWEILNIIKEKRTVGIMDSESNDAPLEVEKRKPSTERQASSLSDQVVNSKTKSEPSCSQSAASSLNNGGQGVDVGFAQPTEMLPAQAETQSNNDEPIF